MNSTIPTELLQVIINLLNQYKTHSTMEVAGLIQAIQEKAKPVEDKEG